MVIVFVLHVPIIKFLLERGRFDASSTQMTSNVLLFYSIGMIGFGIQEILNKAFYALQNTKTPMIISVFGMITNIILSLLFVNIYGISGLALSTSLASIFIATMLVYKLTKKIPGCIEKDTINTFLKTSVSSILSGIVIFYTFNLIGTSISLVFSLFISVTIGITTYVTLAIILKVQEANILINYIKLKLLNRP